MLKAVLFDLDDTLYQETDYVYSGFHAVAHRVSTQYGVAEVAAYSKLVKLLETNGRGKVFDDYLQSINKYSPHAMYSLLATYRQHIPQIKLFDDVIPALKKLQTNNYKLGLITGGAHEVQQQKVSTLGLNQFFDSIVYTDYLDPDFDKPHPIPFVISLWELGCRPQDSVYVGNDPDKDFSGPRLLGMPSIQIHRTKTNYGHAVDATYHISDLNALGEIIHRQ